MMVQVERDSMGRAPAGFCDLARVTLCGGRAVVAATRAVSAAKRPIADSPGNRPNAGSKFSRKGEAVMSQMSRRWFAALAAAVSFAIAGCMTAPAQAQQKPVIKVSSLTLPVFN